MPQMLEKTLSEQFVEEFCHRIVKGEWVTPGQRLRGPIRSGEGQLRKFAARNLPTIICLLDTTVGRFLAEDFHIRAAMYGVETLHFAVSPTTGTGPFLGSTPGKNAMLRRDERTTVSAVAVLRHPPGSEMVVDLYHNQFAAIPIEPGTAAPFVRQQSSEIQSGIKPKRPQSVFKNPAKRMTPSGQGPCPLSLLMWPENPASISSAPSARAKSSLSAKEEK
jgi:hypothetical protein